jgi:hypothetical protein
MVIVKSIMIPTDKNPDLVFLDFINQSMFPVNAPRPTPYQFMLKRLRFTGTFERSPLDFFKKLRYT